MMDNNRCLETLLVAAFFLGAALLQEPLSAAEADIALPPYPYWPNEAFLVDESTMTDYAGAYCSAAGTDSSAVDFYFGYLPLESIDRICAAAPDEADVDALLGNLYISGYFGGVWLRDSMDETRLAATRARFLESFYQLMTVNSGERVLSGASSLASDLTGESVDGEAESVERAMESLVFRTLTETVARQSTAAVEGPALRVLATNRAALPFLLFIYGYNLGYVEVLLENPPAGMMPPDDALSCGDYLLDCRSPSVEMDLLDYYQPAINKLQHSRSVRWQRMDGLVEEYGVSSVESGREVWEEIFSDSSVSPTAYDPLIDLSAGFLLASDVAVLAGMTAWADGQPFEGRCALLVESALVLWSGAYFLGLASDEPVGTCPTLTCG